MASCFVSILLLAAALFHHVVADTINKDSRLAAFTLRVNDIDGNNVIAPHIIYQSTDGSVREVFWTWDHQWKQGGFVADVTPRANTPLAVAYAPAVQEATTVGLPSHDPHASMGKTTDHYQ